MAWGLEGFWPGERQGGQGGTRRATRRPKCCVVGWKWLGVWSVSGRKTPTGSTKEAESRPTLVKIAQFWSDDVSTHSHGTGAVSQTRNVVAATESSAGSGTGGAQFWSEDVSRHSRGTGTVSQTRNVVVAT